MWCSGNHGHMTLSPNFTWYRCSDGKYMTVCALAANQWEHFCVKVLADC